MSNIFEIDGEIEDNDDDGKNSGEGNDQNINDDESQQPEGTQEDSNDSDSDDEEAVSIVFGSGEDETTDEETDGTPAASDEEVPWFDRVSNVGTDSDELEETNHDSAYENEEISISEDEEAPYVSSYEEPEATEPEAEEEHRVEDVSQEEIDQVLAELDQSEKEMEALSYDDEENDTEEEIVIAGEEAALKDEEEESFNDIFPPSNRQPIGITAWIFLILFLIMFSLFSYYQFYDGEKFSINFEHRSEGPMTQLDSLAKINKASQEEVANLMKSMEELTQEIREKTVALESIKNDTTHIMYAVDETGETNPATDMVNLNEGTYYQVQLIALQQYHPDFGGADFSFYVDKEDGFSKMLMGAFLNEDQAKDLYQKVQRSGFNDAFIVKKVNGTRVDYDPNK